MSDQHGCRLKNSALTPRMPFQQANAKNSILINGKFIYSAESILVCEIEVTSTRSTIRRIKRDYIHAEGKKHCGRIPQGVK